MSITIEISYGELIDKITILEIKSERIADSKKLANVNHELTVLNEAWRRAKVDATKISGERDALKLTNSELWDIEDDIRDKEAAQEFDQAFIDLARQVYQTNDRRAQLKRLINDRLGSALVEEKSYQDY